MRSISKQFGWVAALFCITFMLFGPALESAFSQEAPIQISRDGDSSAPLPSGANPVKYDGKTFVSAATNKVMEHPIITTIVATVLGGLGLKSGYSGLAKLAAQSSPGELFGAGTIITGVFTLVNAATYGLNLNYLVTNGCVLGVILVIVGLSVGSIAADNRKKSAS